MKFMPYQYQQFCIDKILDQQNIGLYLDMGLGKTVITLSAIYELKYHRFNVRKALVIAPKKVAERTWNNEAAKWEQLQELRVVNVMGTATQRKAALAETADVYVLGRDNVAWLVEYYGHAWPFDMVVLDESSSFKNPKARRFKALKAVRSKIKRLVELTGTPNPNSLMDLWSQVFLLDGGQRLGHTISVYRDMYFMPDKRNRTTIFSYAPKEGADKAIYQAIGDICISMKAEDYLQLPDLIYHDIPVALDATSQKAYKQLERDALLEIDESEITAGSAGVLTGKLLQLCNGAIYDEDGNVVQVHDCKIDAFMETLEQLHGQSAFVLYNFKHDRDRLLRALDDTSLRVRVYSGAKDEAAWNAGEVDVLLAHPASCGFGLNLQAGGHHVIWFGLTWSLEQYQQANKRLHRQGQDKPVIVHHLITQGGIDEDVMRAISRKADTQDSLLEALKARIRQAKDGRAA